MPDDDAKVFQDAFEIYNKYRWTEMTSDTQWMTLADEVRDFAVRHRWRDNPLAMRAGMMILDVFNDLYCDGKRPAMPDYFGRGDL